MTRPNIVRADTLDLQDQDSPSAAEHQRPTLQNGLGPHQRAEVQHVLEERTSEEHALADAWKMADNLTEEPEVIEEAQQQHNTTTEEGAAANGSAGEGENGGEGGSGDADTDDDMMDRVSSSPSIDDGGYLLSSSSPPVTPGKGGWPERKSSLSPSPRSASTPTATMRETFNQSAPSSAGSSPFLRTPRHLPLHVRRTGRDASPLQRELYNSSSTLHRSTTDLPLITVEDADQKISFASEHHQKLGRYGPAWDPKRNERLFQDHREDEGYHEDDNRGHIPLTLDPRLAATTQSMKTFADDRHARSERLVTVQDRDLGMVAIESPTRGNAFTDTSLSQPGTGLEESPSFTSIGSVDLQDVLLPVDDPLLDTPPSPTDSSGSWESLASSEDDHHGTDHDDDADALFLDLDDRFIDSGWGGECLRETEDIDFEFVYALHTFVATVEGQANATKGDTMVLLDDSNSYWWLVRVVKDGSIGYLPAEHIETPTERLARLNKHRNIDLSATMLGDQNEKTRNPLKKLRRRNVKTVQFAAPTYVEASDYDYDDDEDDGAADSFADGTPAEDAQQNGERSEESADLAAQEESPRASTPTRGSFDREQAATIATEDPQNSPKLVDKTEAAPLKSRKARNTDSFLKDDSIETRKITLTPGLLREEQNKAASVESSRNDSMESLVKTVSPPESLTKKDSKKEKKEKKEGIFKGLFKSKKKDKKSKEDGEPSDEKVSGEFSRESPPVASPLASGRNSPGQERSGATSPMEGKLQQETLARPLSQGKRPEPLEVPSNAAVAGLTGSSPVDETASLEPAPLNTNLAPIEKPKESPLSPITNILKRDDSKSGRPAKAKRAKQRVELDDFDLPADEEGPNPFEDPDEHEAVGDDDDDDDEEDRLSDSPVEITSSSSMHGTESVHIPTPSPYDQPDVDSDDEEPESMTSSPSIIEHPAEPLEDDGIKGQEEDDDSTPRGPQSPTGATGKAVPQQQPMRNLSTDTTSSINRASPSTSMSQQSWNDTSLRAWLEDGTEIKDMMVVIHDKSNVVPVSDDHPLMAGLFREQKKGVQDMMAQLDGLLGSYLERKGIAFG